MPAPSSTGADGAPPPPRRTQDKLKGLLREVIFLAVLVGTVLTARASFADHYYVPSGSMLPTVRENDFLVVNKMAYGLRVPGTSTYLTYFDGPQRGEVVVLSSPTDGTVLLKRITAVPGDEVEVRRHRLIINGEKVPVEATDDGALVENLNGHEHRIRTTQPHTGDFGPTVLGDEEYLVMGDNRGESHDGRAFGPVKRSAILGRAIAIYWREGLTWRKFE